MDPPERRRDGQDGSSSPGIKVDNMMDGEVVGYPLQRLVGRIVGAPSETEGFIQAQVVEQPRDGEDDEESGRWVVAGGRFKALVLLSRGDNTIRLRYVPSNGEASSISLELRAHYEPLLIDNRLARQCQSIVTPAMLAASASSGTDEDEEEKEGKESWRHFVRLIYLIACDDVVGEEGCSGSLDEEAVRTNVARLGLGALMLQAFCAQNLDEDGRAMDLLPFPLGQATFGLEFDSTRPERNWPVVHVVRSRLTREEIYRLGNNWRDGGQSAWGHFASELRGLPHRNNSIDCVILGMTRYNPHAGKCDAHTALGGGPMALFGSGGLYSWPRTLDEVRRCWMDATAVDKTRCFDDSGGRGTMWANFATTLGATLHEIGHCFGLDHTAHGYTAELISDLVRPILKRDEGGAHWHPESIAKLARSPYFKPACLSSALARLLADDPSRPPRRPQRAAHRFEPGVRLQVIPTFRPAQHIRSTHVRWEKEDCGEFFEKCDRPDASNEWIEHREEGACVVLFDASRNLLVKLDRGNAYWACQEETPDAPPDWQGLGPGKWRDDHFTGRHK
ncbi:uncharacterized protein ACA1_054020 [Acanthamoeba castellanii str. Neff]|uniref:Zinc metalloproteinase n=1 Tax=Acanthamoeba castellanii (strain ATCC 30010 / Neff) TaxID=1257118 RepID=L8H7G9_ACACF|nr:uncharacterized protein ACA1_054020 [Acanthamoeba castellanii str. Neff]ELR20658.1 hypothetical protein ACA1_054020 [Acanthamoeba castellanii str. Neff]